MDDLSALLGSLPPEVLEQLMGMGTLDERGQALEQQMLQAQAMRKGQPPQQSSTAGGAIGHGLSNAVNQVAGAVEQKRLLEQQEALFGKKDAGRGAYANALRQQPTAQSQAGYAGMDPSRMAGLFSFGG